MLKNFFTITLLCITAAVYTDYKPYHDFDRDFSPEDIVEMDDPILEELDLLAATRACEQVLTPEEILQILVEKAQLNTVLQKDIYLKTYELAVRPLYYLPALFPPFHRCECWSFDVNIFYNYMPKLFFTECSPFLRDYVDLDDPDILEDIDVKALTDIDIPDVLRLFARIKLYSHRAGGLFTAQKFWNKFAFRFQIPLYYMINHFFLTDEEIENIQNSPLFQGGNLTNDGTSEEAFVRQHLVCDKVGFGDIRLTGLYQLKEWNCGTMNGGIFMTLPSAVTFVEGMIGGSFKKQRCQPKFNIATVINLNDPGQQDPDCKLTAENMMLDLGIETLDTLTANVCDRSLGQQFFGIGPVLTYDRDVLGCGGLSFLVSAEYMVPRTITRFFLAAKNPGDFIRDYSDPATAEQNLAFLNQQLLNTLLPKSVNVRVHPGVMLYGNAALTFNANRVEAVLGGDFWYQTKETIYCDNKNLQIAKGARPSAQQMKLFGRFLAYFPERNYDLRAGLSLDVTLQNKGIGRDYTASINVGITY